MHLSLGCTLEVMSKMTADELVLAPAAIFPGPATSADEASACVLSCGDLTAAYFLRRGSADRECSTTAGDPDCEEKLQTSRSSSLSHLVRPCHVR